MVVFWFGGACFLVCLFACFAYLLLLLACNINNRVIDSELNINFIYISFIASVFFLVRNKIKFFYAGAHTQTTDVFRLNFILFFAVRIQLKFYLKRKNLYSKCLILQIFKLLTRNLFRFNQFSLLAF